MIWILAILVLGVGILAAAFYAGYVSARDAAADRLIERQHAEEPTNRYQVGVGVTVAAPAVWPFPARGVARVPAAPLIEPIPIPDEDRTVDGGDDDYPHGGLPVVSADAPVVDPEAVAVWTVHRTTRAPASAWRTWSSRLAIWWWSRWAPPRGSSITSSTTPKPARSLEVMRRAFAACSA